jgi:hypothetical protein
LLSDKNIGVEARERDLQAGLLYLKSAARRNRDRLAALNSNDDVELVKTADVRL